MNMTYNKPKLYVAGPLTGGPNGPYGTVNEACNFATMAYRAGWLPFLPHINVLWEMVSKEIVPGRGQEGWLEYDFQWVMNCDALVRLPGISPGADREVAVARKHGIPVLAPHEVTGALAADGTSNSWLIVKREKYDQYLL